jgi:hypothetical protein
MTDHLSKPKKNGRAESKDVNWPATAHVEPLQATVSDWSRELNQRVDNPGVSNPKRSKPERELYSRGGGQA